MTGEPRLSRAQTRFEKLLVGAGANLNYYPKNARITAIDLSEKMIALAQEKQDLYFPDNYFDAAVTNDRISARAHQH